MAKDDGTGAVKLIGKKRYGDLLAHARRAKKQVSEINGSYREAVGKAAEDFPSFEPKAHRIINGMQNLEPPMLRRVWDQVNALFELGGLQERYDSAPELSIEAEAGEGEEEDPGAEQGHPRRGRGTVTPMKPPTSVAAE